MLYLSAFCEVDFVGKKALRLQVSRKSLYTDLRCYVYGLNCLKSLLSHRGTIMGKSRLYGLLNATPACRYSRKDPNFFARTTIASFLTSKGDQTTRVRIVGSAYESQVQEDSLDADRRKPESIAVGRDNEGSDVRLSRLSRGVGITRLSSACLSSQVPTTPVKMGRWGLGPQGTIGQRKGCRLPRCTRSDSTVHQSAFCEALRLASCVFCGVGILVSSGSSHRAILAVNVSRTSGLRLSTYPDQKDGRT